MFGMVLLAPLLLRVWFLLVWAVYWVIRLGVRHGSLDAPRQDRLEHERRHARRSAADRSGA